MIIDCDSCAVRGAACTDCVVPLMALAQPGPVFLDDAAYDALLTLADGGLVPPLQMRERDAG